MKELNCVLSDKIIMPYLEGKEYIDCANEAECIAIAGGHFLQTGERANVYFSADGFCNALNFLTSWIIPENIEMNIIISTGRVEPPHKVMTDILPALLELIPYDTKLVSITTVGKKS